MEDKVSPQLRNIFGCAWRLKKSKIEISELTSYDKEFIADLVITSEATTGEINKRTQISARTLRDWVSKRRNNKKQRDFGDVGRAPLLSPEGLKAMQDMVAESDNYSVTVSKFNAKLIDIAEKEKSNRLNEACKLNLPSKRTLKRYDRKLNLTNKNGEETTDARAKATADIRNTASFIAGQLVMAGVSPPELHINIDATSYTVGRDILCERGWCATISFPIQYFSLIPS